MGAPHGALVATDIWAAPPGAADPAVRGVSLTVAPGEWLAITGPNGSGKTTLAMVLAGLWPARRGSVTLAGVPLAPGMRDRRDIAVLFQDPSSQVLQSRVHDELRFAARNLGHDESWIEEAEMRWADTLRLRGDLERDPRQLSAGWQQTLLFASAMLPPVRLLVADEACAHLDRANRERLLAEVERACEGGLAVIWVTQSEDERRRATRTLRLESPGNPNRAAPERCAAVPGPASSRAAARLRVSILTGSGAGRPGIQVPCDTSMDLGPGGLTLVGGPNGVGKSVLLEVLAGLRQIEGVEVQGADAPLAEAILASQYPEEQIFMEAVADELAYAALQRGSARDDVQMAISHYFTALGLTNAGLESRRAWDLSAGEKRIVSVLSALLSPSGLVLLDEPTAGLDAARRAVLRGLIESRADTATVVVATQDEEWLGCGTGNVVHLGAGEARNTPSPSKKTD